MTKLSEQVQNMLDVAEKVLASARTHGPQVALVLAAKAKDLQGSTTQATSDAFQSVMGYLADGLTHANTTLRTAEFAYFAEKADDVPIREARDLSVNTVVTMLGQLRTAVEGALGPSAVKTYGLLGDLPRTPHKLVLFANNVVKQLVDHPQKVTTTIGTTFDTAPAAAAIQTKVTDLAGLVEDNRREARELEEALANRNRAMDAWSNAYQSLASTLEGLYRAAGYVELAEKVRPTQRKSRGDEPGEDIEPVPPAQEG